MSDFLIGMILIGAIGFTLAIEPTLMFFGI